ncbi:molybdenum cofactor synthesis domain-containing protein [Ascodesmis nigricans]|uniref:Molybdenum cofactor synthesis domain-containing protein n=1 Tax=Ascodesmis nigricans TaxID=341454 RepID=A0A4S2N0A6_9PEZI|nr:molybdenum cofactor synthesis domain-containing protein [Ascodesmis nigricans]
MPALTVGILVVSTTASQHLTVDTSTSALTEVFEHVNGESQAAQWEVKETTIVCDDIEKIQATVKKWADEEKLNLIVTTGGTGFAVKDVTPEAVRPLLQKEAPGLVHAMLSGSLEITPFAMMSRPVAGVRNQSVIITVPGSPKGAKETLGFIVRTVPHACIQAAGMESSRKLHQGGTKQLEKTHGITEKAGHFHISHSPSGHAEHGHNHHSHGCGHSHGHQGPKRHQTVPRANDLNAAVTRRHRESPYPMIPVGEAHNLISQHTPVLSVQQKDVNADLIGYVLAEDITAPEAVPAFRASIVDGYAVIHTDGPGVYPVVAVSHAAPGAVPQLKPGQIARITTGAPLPPGATAVIMVEETAIKTMTADDKEEKEVEIFATGIAENDNVREAGSDVEAGTVILKAGTAITSSGGEIGLLASVGVSSVRVFRKPVVGVLSTGDELVDHNNPRSLEHGEIRDSNRPTLLSAIQAQGFTAVDLGIAADKSENLSSDLTRDANCDVIITTGGVSMGELDLLKPTIEQSLKGTIHFGRVAMKPGKPTTFATFPSTNAKQGDLDKLIFALPGNPASALVTFYLFVLPSLRKSAGYVEYHLPRVRVVAGNDLRIDPRPEYHRVFVKMQNDGRLAAFSTGGQRSSRIGSAAQANGVACLPAKSEVGEKREKFGYIPKGETVTAVLWGQIGGLSGLM